MPRPALDLHEVLECEYVSMYGPIELTTELEITEKQILDRDAARKKLVDAGIAKAGDDLVTALNDFLNDAKSPHGVVRVSAAAESLLIRWSQFDAVTQRRLKRRVVDGLLEDAIIHFHDAVYSADQIRDLDGSRLTLRGFTPDHLPNATAIAMQLETLRKTTTGSKRPPDVFFDSPQLSNGTRALINRYDDYDIDDQIRINRRIIDEALTDCVVSFHDDSLQRLFERVHARAGEDRKGVGRTALCISGGGIRSATFALGVLQGLASFKLLDRFDYLSTVSGGGYIGSWLSSWARRHPRGIAGVQDDLASTEFTSTPRSAPSSRTIEPEAKPIRHLRAYSNYLTPKLGLLSADTWTMASLYARNVTLNLGLVIIPLLAAVLGIPRLFEWAIVNGGRLQMKNVNLLQYGLPWLIDLFLLWGFGYLGTARPVSHGVKSEPRWRWLRGFSSDSRFVLFAVIPLMIAALGMCIYWSYAADHLDVMKQGFAWPAAIGVFGMVAVPCSAFYGRYLFTSFAQRKQTVSMRKSEAVTTYKRALLEFLGALLGLVAAVTLLWIGVYFFADDPLRALPPGDIQPFLLPDSSPAAELFVAFGVPYILLTFFLQATIFVGIAGWRNDDYDREWWGRAGAWLLISAFGYAAMSAIVIFGPLALYRAPAILASLGGLSGLIAVLVGRSDKTPANKKQEEGAGTLSMVSNIGLSLVVPVFVVIVLAAVSLATTWGIQRATDQSVPERFELLSQFTATATHSQRYVAQKVPYVVLEKGESLPRVSLAQIRGLAHLGVVRATTLPQLGVLLALALAGFWFSRYICVNRFSMHALYRNRLVRAYLGASRFGRDPDPFTGFDPYDDFPMWRLRPEMLWGTSIINLHELMEELVTAKKQPSLSPHVIDKFSDESKDLLYRLVAGHRLDTFCGVALQLCETAPDRVTALAKHVDTLSTNGLPATSKASKIVMTCRKKLKKALMKKEPAKEKLAGIAAAARRGLFGIGDENSAVSAIFQELNTIIDDGSHDLGNFLCPKSPAAEGESRAVHNRHVLDSAYREYIVGMPAPARERDCSIKEKNLNRLSRRPPMHVVNMALNLVGGEKLAWQQRQAESFTVSPFHAGSFNLGYRPSTQYGGIVDGISLGTAVTISGAAASPNMGYHSSPALSFLLTLFNVRLGAWLGNPGPVGDKGEKVEDLVYRQANPSKSLAPMIAEALGKTNDEYDWVYLSDGGHFENLGVYEMVLRRCHTIIVSDAGCDPNFKFEDLGNAVRKIRTDFGIPIELSPFKFLPRDSQQPGWYWAIGNIHYAAVDGANAPAGKLLYIKPAFYDKDDNVPKDVYNYAKERIDFPHESTGDQWFSETQFESYRALGRFVTSVIAGEYPIGGTSLAGFMEKIRQ